MGKAYTFGVNPNFQKLYQERLLYLKEIKDKRALLGDACYDKEAMKEIEEKESWLNSLNIGDIVLVRDSVICDCMLLCKPPQELYKVESAGRIEDIKVTGKRKIRRQFLIISKGEHYYIDGSSGRAANRIGRHRDLHIEPASPDVVAAFLKEDEDWDDLEDDWDDWDRPEDDLLTHAPPGGGRLAPPPRQRPPLEHQIQSEIQLLSRGPFGRT